MHDTVGHDHETIVIAQTASAAPTTTATTRAQQEWLRLFELPRRHSYRHRENISSAAPLTETTPVVGGDYDFVETQQWPRDIVHVANNVYNVSQPYPVSKRYSSYHDDCECEGERCMPDNGTRYNSSCINVNQDIVCDDSICFVGSTCGNRLKQRYTLDLISTRVGLGVICSVTIPKDAFIVEYVGEVLLGPDAIQRYQVEMKTKGSWEGPTDVFIDAARCGNESRFINHSCSPNCGLFELEWTNTSRLGVFAKDDIPPLRELTLRYRASNLSLFTCQCGRTNCISHHT